MCTEAEFPAREREQAKNKRRDWPRGEQPWPAANVGGGAAGSWGVTKGGGLKENRDGKI